MRLNKLDKMVLASLAVCELGCDEIIKMVKASTGEPFSWLVIQRSLRALRVLGFVERKNPGINEKFCITDSGVAYLLKN